jgi:hypothetical protein
MVAVDRSIPAQEKLACFFFLMAGSRPQICTKEKVSRL